jgi:hypothetical protein
MNRARTEPGYPPDVPVPSPGLTGRPLGLRLPNFRRPGHGSPFETAGRTHVGASETRRSAGRLRALRRRTEASVRRRSVLPSARAVATAGVISDGLGPIADESTPSNKQLRVVPVATSHRQTVAISVSLAIASIQPAPTTRHVARLSHSVNSSVRQPWGKGLRGTVQDPADALPNNKSW